MSLPPGRERQEVLELLHAIAGWRAKAIDVVKQSDKLRTLLEHATGYQTPPP